MPIRGGAFAVEADIYVAGLRRSPPIADYLVYGLIRGERAASLLGFAGGMAGPQVSTLGPQDVLVAIAFPPYSTPVVDAVMDRQAYRSHH